MNRPPRCALATAERVSCDRIELTEMQTAEPYSDDIVRRLRAQERRDARALDRERRDRRNYTERDEDHPAAYVRDPARYVPSERSS